MSNKKQHIAAVIPARGGSKGIRKKNIYPIHGKPLICYTVEAALASQHLDTIHLNTEDAEIKEACLKYEINCQYTRPSEFAEDNASTEIAILDWLEYLNHIHQLPDVIVLLQPTSPLRTAAMIDEAILSFIEKGCQSLVGVHEMTEHPYKSLHLNADNSWSYLARPKDITHRRQDYDKNYYVLNGSIYIVNVDWFLRKKQFVVENETQLFFTSKIAGIDIDEIQDIYLVEAILANQ